jgi:hypothetical protein
MEIDSSLIEEYWSSCAVGAHARLNRRFPYLGGANFLQNSSH